MYYLYGLQAALAEERGGGRNFGTFPSAVMLLVRCATGEDWHLIMYECAGERLGCTREPQSAGELERGGPMGCGSPVAYL